ncbi:uncharacterized protein LOC123907916 [Trifolium pratense]|uniref:Uncharacterized protein n=2 Tax=Trifolium pratense TaxID=57577 RepID=A0ACB0JN03_TRIPR|nr:uncharacterized protein LOC123907916 [Trifolium pratense]CAJ2646370.1 unnamed protein product [Trifolium pratense]
MEASKMLLFSPLSTPKMHIITHSTPQLRRPKSHNLGFKIKSMAKEGSDTNISTTEIAAIAGGLISTPVIGWSLYTLKTTGCGLPPGPGGSIGALEGISYLVVVGIVGWSLYTKTKTGSGLPNGPFGLLGAVEGLSYLALVAIIVVFGLQYFQQGYIPGPLPADQCFG